MTTELDSYVVWFFFSIISLSRRNPRCILLILHTVAWYLKNNSVTLCKRSISCAYKFSEVSERHINPLST